MTLRCASCKEIITWERPIVYIGYNRGIHVDEFVAYIETHTFWKKEILEGSKRRASRISTPNGVNE